MPNAYEICMIVSIIVVLLVATFYDCTSGTIPMFLFPILPALILPAAAISGNMDVISSIAGLLAGTATFWVLAYFFDGGGGDVIMMGMLGLCLGIHDIIILILASSAAYAIFATAFVIAYAAKGKAKEALKKQYPFAPFVFAGFITCLLFEWLF